MSTADWGYYQSNGPSTWCKCFPLARGVRQSPIDICPSEVVSDAKLQTTPFKLSYKAGDSKRLRNTGQSFVVEIESSTTNLTGGPLQSDYRLAQFHFHWGRSNKIGSEHTVNDESYASEVHLVHYDCKKYANFTQAVDQPKGLCVLGAFLQPGACHPSLKALTKLFPQIAKAGSVIDLKDGFDPICLLPTNRKQYWTYDGSLTTPPCFESVVWVVFREPVQLGEEELKAFRSLMNKDGGPLFDNYRPTMKLNDRIVKASF